MMRFVSSGGKDCIERFLRFVLLSLLLASGGCPGQIPAPPEEPQVACSSDSPIVDEGASVPVRAWAMPKDGALPAYEWTAGVGRIIRSGSEFSWDFSDVSASPRPLQASVKVTYASGITASCSIHVTVAALQRGGRAPARSFLIKGGKPEREGFGLYSYFLLGSRPKASTRDRYLLAIRAYLAAMEDVSDQKLLPPATLNVTYLPVQTDPLPNANAEWLLDNYDYTHAQALLHALPGDLTDGPYIVSTLKPLNPNTRPGQYLFQDLSTVPTKPNELISWWVREFTHQSAQERFWEPKTGELLALKLRTTIAVLAVALPDVQQAIAGWVSWKH